MTTLAKVDSIIEFFTESGLVELSYEKDDLKVLLRRDAGECEYDEDDDCEPDSAPVAEDAAIKSIKSTMVGTYYDADPKTQQLFIQLGTPVAAGAVIGLIETMKVINEIKAESDCVVTETLLQSGDPVEYGQDLFYVE